VLPRSPLSAFLIHAALCVQLSLAALPAGAQIPLEEAEATAVPSGSLELWVVPSWDAITWSSPAEVVKSFAQSLFGVLVGEYFSPETKRSRLGHALVRLQCGGETWTTIKGDLDNRNSHDVLKEGLGMGVLFRNLADGILLSSEEVSDAVARTLQANRRKPAFLRVPLTSDECAASLSHLDAFRARAKQGPLLYGFTADPLRLEGGSCTSYAVSFLHVARASLLEAISPDWERTLTVGESLIGVPEHGKSVPFYKVAAMESGNAWALADEATRSLTFTDPQRMYDWIRDLRSCARSADHCPRDALLPLVESLGARAVSASVGGTDALGVSIR
jgi:hypothetical protein